MLCQGAWVGDKMLRRPSTIAPRLQILLSRGEDNTVFLEERRAVERISGKGAKPLETGEIYAQVAFG